MQLKMTANTRFFKRILLVVDAYFNFYFHINFIVFISLAVEASSYRLATKKNNTNKQQQQKNETPDFQTYYTKQKTATTKRSIRK